MTDTVALELIKTVGTIFVAIFSFAGTLVGAYNSWQITKNSKHIEDIRNNTNGIKDELVKVTRSDALQQGKAEGKAEEKREQAEVLKNA